jgi:5S rRNA maturation endonuclease (ribonuclease M5)
MTAKKNGAKDIENDIPNEVFTSSDPNFWDYVRLKDITKNTGIEAKDCHPFSLKELLDNAADFSEKYYADATIIVSITHSKDWFRIAVRNSNSKNIPVFPNLVEAFNYKRAYSSKSSRYRVTRGVQGDAIKKMGTIPYALINAEGSIDKQWKEPLIIQHNNKIDKAYFQVDRKHGEIKVKFTNSEYCDSTDTEVILTLPALDENNYKRFKNYCKEYTLFNTHISYKFYFDQALQIDLPALNHIIESPAACTTCGYRYDRNSNSVYCYSETDLNDFLNDIFDKNISVYNAINRSGFREIHQHDGRFDDWNSVMLEQLTFSRAKKLHSALRKSMLPVSKLSVPNDTKRIRKSALLARYEQIKPGYIEIDSDKAVYSKTKDAIYKDDNIQFPFIFEVLAIPIKSGSDESIVIRGVNYSTSITNKRYFEGQYTNTYEWAHGKTEEELEASDIIEIIRKSAVGENISNEASIPIAKQKVPCVIIAHLAAPRIEYISYGKSALTLTPFSHDIAETIEELVRKIPAKSRYSPGKYKPDRTGCLRQLLEKRWDDVRRNPGILDHNSNDYDPWTQSTVWYHLREEYLLPIEERYHITVIKENTRDDMTQKISEICESDLEGNPTREQLAIFASPRATLYFDGTWHNVDIDDIPSLAGKGTDVVFIEKRGALEIVKYIGDDYGIAFVNTQGHFAEYPKDLIREINEQDGRVAILTDFDCAGIHIAEKVISEDIESENDAYKKKISTKDLVLNLPHTIAEMDTAPPEQLKADEDYMGKHYELQKLASPKYTDRVRRLGIDADTLAYFVRKEIQEKGIEDEINDEELYNERLEQFQQEVEEPYPKASDPEKQQPGKNVITPIIRYARLYHSFLTNPGDLNRQGYKRYEYIYNNLEYLTGISPNDIWEKDPKPIEGRARRIEIDSVIKVVRASKFAQFILDKLQEFFPDRNYNRAIKPLTEYYAEKFHILPDSTQKLLLYIKKIAEMAAKPTQDEIESELEQIDGMLYLPDEEAEIEKRISEAVSANSDMKILDEKISKFMHEGGMLESST